MSFIEGDFTDPALLAGLGQFELVLLVNALHEVFSACYSPELGEVDVPPAKARVRQALGGAAGCLAPGGWLVLFDGLEPPGDGGQIVRIRFQDWQARRRFETFAREFQPFRIQYRETGEPGCVELSQHDFTRYIDKSIFLDKSLWQTERLESYQYFTEAEFRQALAGLGLTIHELRTLTVNYEKWQAEVEILTPGVDFPAEHILILAQKASAWAAASPLIPLSRYSVRLLRQRNRPQHAGAPAQPRRHDVLLDRAPKFAASGCSRSGFPAPCGGSAGTSGFAAPPRRRARCAAGRGW